MVQGHPADTNGFAIASLVTGILGLSGLPVVGAILALVFGRMARREIEETGQKGEGLATAGIILGWVGIAVGILMILAIIAVITVFSISSVEVR